MRRSLLSSKLPLPRELLAERVHLPPRVLQLENQVPQLVRVRPLELKNFHKKKKN